MQTKLKYHQYKSFFKQNGVFMLEVLVSIIIISVGFLGVVHIQLRGLQINQNSYHRSEAAWASNEFISRLQANRASIFADGYGGNGSTSACSTIILTSPSPTCDEPATPCTPVQMAAWDRYQWCQSINTYFPKPVGNEVEQARYTIACSDISGASINCNDPAVAEANFQITLQWLERGAITDKDSVYTVDYRIINR